MKSLDIFWKNSLSLLEKELKKYIHSNSLLYKVMAYSLLDGGKRLRPLLVLAASDAVGGKKENVLPAACALEMIHTFSLIHDDLPALDNDDFRRGKLSSHKKFGEALAILAGDALLTKAFEILAEIKETAPLRQVLKELSLATGGEGMIGGQVMDISINSRLPITKSGLENIYRKKTGTLIKVCLKIGALLSGAKPEEGRALEKYGENIGLAFQIGDDLIDYKEQEETTSLSYPRIFGIKQTKKRVKELTGEAKKTLRIFGRRGKILSELADLISRRKK